MNNKQKLKNKKYVPEIKNSIDRFNSRLFIVDEEEVSGIIRMKDRKTDRKHRRKVKRHRRYSEMF